jgi:tetratricopeptide (TPR) repeat protein
MNLRLKIQLLILVILGVNFGLKLVQPSLILAQSYEVNPLEITEKDELLPSRDRPLSEFEQNRLKTALQELEEQAQAKLKEGKDDEAFTIWYRQIRLTRALGTVAEIEALTRVGAIAWEKSRNQEINNINERLVNLESENKLKNGQIKPDLLPLFAQAYETIHSLDKSIEIYQQILTNARQEQNQEQIKFALDKLGQFYLVKFDYFSAEPVYKELLTIARENQDFLQEGVYLRKLAEINSELTKPENAVIYKQALAENQVKNQQLANLPLLKIQIGDDYKLLDKPEEATKNYQEAFNLALSLQQISIAGDALKKLAQLYEDYQYPDFALTIYQELIKIEQQSYNLYGLMNTYDSIAKIYVQQENYRQALPWLEKGLEIADHLKYKQDYFLTKIQGVKQKIQ